MVKLYLRVLDAADKDVDDLADYIAARNLEAGVRFLLAAGAEFERLAEMPGKGTLVEHRSPRLIGLRRWPIRGFRNYLIFYRATPEAVEILRVLHGARDIDALLDRDLQD